MNFFFCVAFGAGVAAWSYRKFGKYVGYGNKREITIMLAVIFVISTAFFYSIVKFFVPDN